MHLGPGRRRFWTSRFPSTGLACILGKKGTISHSCQRWLGPWRLKRGLPELPAPPAAQAGPTRSVCRAGGMSPRARDVSKGEEGVQRKAGTGDPSRPADTDPLTWGPDGRVPARSWAAGPTPTALPQLGGQSPRPQPSRRPGGPGTPAAGAIVPTAPASPARPPHLPPPGWYLRPRMRPAAPTPGWPPPWPARNRTGPVT